MNKPSHPKPGLRPGSIPAAPANQGPRSAPGTAPSARPGTPAAGGGGKVVHDSRGNAVWDWVKQTGRQALDSTSRLLKKLEAPELKVEDTHDEELRIVSDAPAGGGFDPYNQSNRPRGPAKK